MIIRHIGKKALDGIVIERAVHPSVIIMGGVVDPRQCEHAAEKFRSSEKDDRRVGGTHINSHHYGLLSGGGILLNYGQYLFRNMPVIILLPRAAPGIDPLFTIPALVIYGVDAEQLHPSIIQIRGQGSDHAEFFIIAGTAALGGKTDKGNSGSSVLNDTHVFIKAAAVNNKITSFHLHASIGSGYMLFLKDIFEKVKEGYPCE